LTVAPDFAVHYLSSPLGVGFLLAILGLPTLFLRVVAWRSFERLGLRPVAQGYGAVIAAMLVVSGSVVFTGGGSMARAWYVFVLLLILVLPFASLVVMPLSVCLARAGVATVALMAGAGVLSALALGALAAAYPSNEWGRTHRLEAFVDTVLSVGVVATIAFCAFALGARMPLWRFSRRALAASKAA
jgi:hypothetical protein